MEEDCITLMRGEIEDLNVEISILRSALKPFAACIGPENADMDDKSLSAAIFTFADLRAARAALEKKND